MNLIKFSVLFKVFHVCFYHKKVYFGIDHQSQWFIMIVVNPSFARHFFPWVIWRDCSGKQTVYLTFDDGPHPEHTPEILGILRDHQAAGTFFLGGEKIVRHPGLVKRIHRDGHVIGNHGFSHTSLAWKKRHLVFEEIERTSRMIGKITGSFPRFFRPPYGRFDWRFKKWMNQMNMRLVNWSLLTEDFREHSPEFLLKRVQDHIHAGAILLMHDGLPATPNLIQALPGILDFLHKNHFRTAALSELEY